MQRNAQQHVLVFKVNSPCTHMYTCIYIFMYVCVDLYASVYLYVPAVDTIWVLKGVLIFRTMLRFFTPEIENEL